HYATAATTLPATRLMPRTGIRATRIDLALVAQLPSAPRRFCLRGTVSRGIVAVPVDYFPFAVLAAVYVCDADHNRWPLSAVHGHGNVLKSDHVRQFPLTPPAKNSEFIVGQVGEPRLEPREDRAAVTARTRAQAPQRPGGPRWC